MAGFADALSLLDAMDQAEAGQAPQAPQGPSRGFADALSILDAMDQADDGGGDFQAALEANGGNLYGQGMAGFYERPQVSSPRMDPVRDPLGGQSIDVGSAFHDAGQGANGWAAAGIGAANMMTLGYGDELAGKAVGAVLGPEAGQQATEAVRGVLGGAREAHPYASLAGEVAGGFLLPVSRLGQGASWLAKALGGVATGAGYGAAYGSGSADDGDRVAGAGWGALGGAAGGALAVPLGAIAGKATGWIGNLVRQRRFFANGQMTPQGRSLLQRAGVDPDEIGPALQRQFAQDAARAASPEDAAAAAPFREFNIPAYRHNVTGTVEDAARFHGAARGGRGPAAEARVRPALEAQDQAARDAAERIATDLSGGRRGDQLDAAMAVQQGLRTARDGARATAQRAYEELEAAGGLVGGDAVKGIGNRIALRVRSQCPLSSTTTPNASAAIEEITAALRPIKTGGAGPLPGVQSGKTVPRSIPFMELERVRQSIVKMSRGAQGADEVAMGRVMDAFDNEVEGLITSALISGDDAIAKAQNARALWSAYARQFRGEGAGSRFIQRMIHEDASPDEAVRWLFGASKLGGGGFTSNLAREVRGVLGDTSEEWAMVRQAAWRQLTMKPEGQVQPGPQQVSERVLGFFNSPATRPLAAELFSPSERALMLRYAGVLKRTVPPAGAVNHSGSGYEVSRVTRDALRAVMTALTATTQGPVAGMAAQAAGRGVSAAADRMGTGAMLRPLPPRPAAPVPAPGVPLGAAGLDWVRERTGR